MRVGEGGARGAKRQSAAKTQATKRCEYSSDSLHSLLTPPFARRSYFAKGVKEEMLERRVQELGDSAMKKMDVRLLSEVWEEWRSGVTIAKGFKFKVSRGGG